VQRHRGIQSTETTHEGLSRFFHNVRKYLRDSAEFCNDLASGSADESAILQRLRSIGATRKFDGPEPEYHWLGLARI
jgi:hypothetical protein